MEATTKQKLLGIKKLDTLVFDLESLPNDAREDLQNHFGNDFDVVMENIKQAKEKYGIFVCYDTETKIPFVLNASGEPLDLRLAFLGHVNAGKSSTVAGIKALKELYDPSLFGKVDTSMTSMHKGSELKTATKLSNSGSGSLNTITSKLLCEHWNYLKAFNLLKNEGITNIGGLTLNLSDCPGHETYQKNAMNVASIENGFTLYVLVITCLGVDYSTILQQQTKKHFKFIAANKTTKTNLLVLLNAVDSLVTQEQKDSLVEMTMAVESFINSVVTQKEYVHYRNNSALRLRERNVDEQKSFLRDLVLKVIPKMVLGAPEMFLPQPFIAQIEVVNNVPGIGSVLSCTCLSGSLSEDQKNLFLCLPSPNDQEPIVLPITLKTLQIQHKPVTKVRNGEAFGMTFQGKLTHQIINRASFITNDPKNIENGKFLLVKGSFLKVFKDFNVMTGQEDGALREGPVNLGFKPQLMVQGNNVAACLVGIYSESEPGILNKIRSNEKIVSLNTINRGENCYFVFRLDKQYPFIKDANQRAVGLDCKDIVFAGSIVFSFNKFDTSHLIAKSQMRNKQEDKP